MRTRRWRMFLLPTILAVVTACGPIEFPHVIRMPREVPPATTVKVPEKHPAPELRLEEIAGYLESGDYRSALELVRTEIGRGTRETSLAEEYVQAVNGVINTAELHQEADQLAKAGELFRLAHEWFPKTEAASQRVDLTSGELMVRIADCADGLMDRGLVAYRGGDLDKAIESWKVIGTFDPWHQESRRALETAEVQRANLEKVRGANSQPVTAEERPTSTLQSVSPPPLHGG
ncbi:MAG: hypothetical protein C0616_01380 [Desulfuromonas sp.]|nr:MAG: hypothetical protein C0616_01380 [Desulfuromonas sp.]